LELAHGDGRFPRVFKSFIKTDLLILDDWGPDRLNHHVHILEMNGESYRLKHSRKHKQIKSE